MKKIISFIATILILAACNDNNTSTSEDDLLNDSTIKQISIPREMLDEMMQTLPKPTEIASIISILADKEFSVDILVPSKRASQLTSKYSQAIGLGAYGVDLGYINLKEKSLYTIQYLQSVRTLANELNVDQFFDFETLGRMAKNKGNIDSLVYISTVNFTKIDNHLRDNNRGDLSVMMLVGAWLEGMHMYVEISKNTSNPAINDMIAEQKVVFDNIFAILSNFKSNNYYNEFCNTLTPLKNSFDVVKINYEYKAPETKEVDGKLVITDNTTTTIVVTTEQIKNIGLQVEALRNKLLLQ